MRRREFITLLGGAAVTWPLAVRAQQPERIRRVGVLMFYGEADREGQAFFAAFRDALQKLGWAEGTNIRVDARWAGLDEAATKRFAEELVALQPDLIFSHNTPTTSATLQQTRIIPIVFAIVADPVSAGFVTSFPRPGGNATGFTTLEPTMAGKWLELLKVAAPRINRAALVFNPKTAPFVELFMNSFKGAAASLAVEAIIAHVGDSSALETVVAAQAREPNGGLVVMPDTFLTAHHAQIHRWRLAIAFPPLPRGVSMLNLEA